MIISFLLLLILISLTYISIAGYGKFFINSLKLQNTIVDDFKLIEFIFGLIFLGFFGILFNFFFKISNFFSIILITVGIIFFIFFLLKINNKINYVYYIILLIFFSSFFSFYSLMNDDFGYHFRTIVNFKKIHYLIFLMHFTKATTHIGFF